MREKYVKLDDVIATLEAEWGYEGIREDLEKLPTADVVEVVRCKDCKRYKKTPYGDEMLCQCWADWLPTGQDDFCSCGERKEQL